jgi:hypothetical protein
MDSLIEPGTEHIYRLRDFAPSERARVVAVDRRKKTSRYEVEFLDGEKAGTVENVPAGRLRGAWSGVDGYGEYTRRGHDELAGSRTQVATQW